MIDAKILSAFIAFCAFCFGVFQWWKNRKITRLSIDIQSSVIADGTKTDDIQILVSGSIVRSSQIVLSTIRIQNTGTVAISAADLSPNNSLALDLNGKYSYSPAAVLSAKRSRVSNLAIEWSVNVSDDKHSISVQFDVLNPKQGVEVLVFHDGAESKVFRSISQIKDGQILMLDANAEKMPSLFREFPVLLIRCTSLIIVWAGWSAYLLKETPITRADVFIISVASMITGSSLHMFFSSLKPRQRISTDHWTSPRT